MDCPQCHTSNPPTAERCSSCDAPLSGSASTLVGTLTPPSVTPATPPTPSGPTAVPGNLPEDPTMLDTPGVASDWSRPISTGAGIVVTRTISALRPGSVLGKRYEIQDQLGEGGMGTVYKARDLELERLVALKVIRPELAGRPEILQRFKQELILARKITHRNVIRIFDLGEAEGIKFITMEFIEGRDLKSLMLEQKKLAPEQAVNIIQQMCLALEAAHAEGVVHRDLKPQNVMLDKQGKASVMDFGIARSLEPGGMTQTGALIGTPEYMSPEQVRGEHPDARSDLFTVGIIFYELLIGQMPYQADTAMATMFKRTKEPALPVRQLNSSVPQYLSDVVAKCLEIEPADRFQSAREIYDSLEAWKTGANSPVSIRALRWTRKLARHRLAVGSLAAIVVLLTLGVIFRGKLSFTSSSRQPAPVEVRSLAILPFRNASGDPAIDWLGPSLAEMLTSDVGQSSQLRTVSADRIHQILKDLRVPANSDFEPNTLKQLADFSSAQTLVWGQYVKVGEQIRIDATLQDLKRQRTIPLKAEAPNGKVLQAITQLAQAIQQNLSVSSDVLRELRGTSFLPSTASQEALRNYNEGLDLNRQGKKMDAAKSFEAAIHEDPQFALAYSKLARIYADLGYDDKAEQFSRRAVEFSDTLPQQQRYLIQANQALILNDSKKAIESYENLAKVLPGDSEVHFNLAGMYESAGALDKARAEYAKVLASDPKQVDALQAAGRVEIKSGNAQGGLDYLNRALTLAIQLENDEERATILQAMGVAYKKLSKFDEALSNYQESLKIKRRLGQKRGIGASLNEIGQIEVRLGRPEGALAAFTEALQVRREIGDKKGIGDTLIDLGNFYVDHGRGEEGLKLFKESLQIQRDIGNENYQALCFNNIGNTYLAMGDYENARTYFEQALQIREKFKVPQDVAQTLHNLAETSVAVGQYDQALAQYMRAVELRRNAGDKRGAAMESYSMGTLFEYQGRYGAALAAKEEALKTFRDLQDHSFWMGEILSGYGHSLAQVGRYDDASKSLEEALRLARELKNQALIAQTLNFQGDTFFFRNELKPAKALFEQALQEASRTPDRIPMLLSRINLAKIAVQEGRPQTAISSLKALVRNADTIGVKNLSTQCTVYLGQALLDTRQYAAARQELESAERKSEKLGLKALLAQSHYLLAQTLERTGDTASAALHSREARRILEEIHAEAHTDAILKRGDLKRIAAQGG